MMRRAEKVVTLSEAVRRIEDGSTIAIGGLSYFNAPMALVRELIRQRKRALTVITAAVTGIQVDMLIGAGCVRRLISPYVGMEELGAAPNFRRAAESGEIEVCEIGEAFLAFGLKAGAAGAPFFALPRALAATDLVRVNPEYRFTRDPFTGEEVLCVPALAPEWALLHAQQSDPFGNARHLGSAYMDALLARAARRVIVSCDELVPHEAVRAEPQSTTVPSVLVDLVVPLYGSAHPTASEPFYDVDREHLRRGHPTRSRDRVGTPLSGAQPDARGDGSVSRGVCVFSGGVRIWGSHGGGLRVVAWGPRSWEREHTFEGGGGGCGRKLKGYPT